MADDIECIGIQDEGFPEGGYKFFKHVNGFILRSDAGTQTCRLEYIQV